MTNWFDVAAVHRKGDLLDGVEVWENTGGGGIIAGAPHVLSAICLSLGFKNPCKRGRVYLTGAKMRHLGLGDAPGTWPNWRAEVGK